MQIQIKFLAKSLRRLFFPPLMLKTPVSSLLTAVWSQTSEKQLLGVTGIAVRPKQNQILWCLSTVKICTEVSLQSQRLNLLSLLLVWRTKGSILLESRWNFEKRFYMWNIMPSFPPSCSWFCSAICRGSRWRVVVWPPLCTDVNDCAKYKAIECWALPTLQSRNELANSFHGDAAYKLAKEHKSMKISLNGISCLSGLLPEQHGSEGWVSMCTYVGGYKKLCFWPEKLCEQILVKTLCWRLSTWKGLFKKPNKPPTEKTPKQPPKQNPDPQLNRTAAPPPPPTTPPRSRHGQTVVVFPLICSVSGDTVWTWPWAL